MQFVHSREYLHQGDVVVIDCSHQSNVLLTDDSNFNKYRRRQKYSYFGGRATHFPTKITAPRTGYWNVTIDLGGGSANIRHSINIIRA